MTIDLIIYAVYPRIAARICGLCEARRPLGWRTSLPWPSCLAVVESMSPSYKEPPPLLLASPQVEGWSENPFPFQELDLPEFCVQVRNEDRQPRSKSRGLTVVRMVQNKCSLLSGNYIAGNTLAQLRIQAKASRRGMANLEAIADLPMELFLLVWSSPLTTLNSAKWLRDSRIRSSYRSISLHPVNASFSTTPLE